MGILITAEREPLGSGFDQWKLHRSTTEAGSYSVVATQDITDMTYYDADGGSTHWYKVTYYNSDTTKSSALTSAFTSISNTYTNVQKVSSYLQLSTLSDTTSPTIQEVSQEINKTEDEIDRQTQRAWRLRYSGTETDKDTTPKYIYIDVNNVYEYGAGIRVSLPNRNVKSFDADEDDVLELWNGSSYTDYLADKTEDRGDDFWVDYEEGTIFIRSFIFLRGKFKMRVKYRYGMSVVPYDIEKLATLKTARELLMSSDKDVMVPEGGMGLNNAAKIDKMDTMIEKLEGNFLNFTVIA